MPVEVRAFAPGSVSNVACGFDTLGFAIDQPGDHVTARFEPEPGPRSGLRIEIEDVLGDGGRLPREATRNTAGVAASSLVERAAARGRSLPDGCVKLLLEKGMPLSSGLGSSAASANAAVLAVDALLELGMSRDDLLLAALDGEQVASGGRHADNIAPSLLGGFVLVRGLEPPDIVKLPIPEGLSCALVRPHLEIETRGARVALGDSVPLRDAVTQGANLGAFVAALFCGDFDLLRRSLVDVIAEPKRRGAIPCFGAMRRAALEAGALGVSLSGSGPSIFALAATPDVAERAATAMREAVEKSGLEADRWVSPVGATGARITSRSCP